MTYLSVFSYAPTFLTDLEGRLECMYPDVKGLVTTAIGVLIEPVQEALNLPWRKKNAAMLLATQDEITAEWNRMHGNMVVAEYGNHAKLAFATLVLMQSDLDDVVNHKLHQFEAVIQGRIPNFNWLPADAQLGILAGIAWGAGPWFHWPLFLLAVSHENFQEAVVQCYTRAFNENRNAANKILFQNSSIIAAEGLDRSTLYFPRDLKKEKEDVQISQSGPPGATDATDATGGV